MHKLLYSIIIIAGLNLGLYADTLNNKLINKGKIEIQNTFFGVDYYYESEPDQKFSSGLFTPDQLTKAMKPVDEAYKYLKKSENAMLLSYLWAVPTGAFLGMFLREETNKEINLLLGVAGLAATIINEMNGYRYLGNGVELYNKKIEKAKRENSGFKINPFIYGDSLGLTLTGEFFIEK